jgi:uncharacterized protein (DUF1501 family)
MNESRRKFLRTSACGLTGAAMIAGLDQLNLVDAMVQEQADVATDYKALVCIFLFGGSDCNNMVIPFDDYNIAGGYGAVRTASGLAIPQAALTNTKITPANTAGVSYALHPNLSPEANNAGVGSGFLDIWNAGKLAVLCNVGPLTQPITRAQYISGIGHPYQLFSHSDQVTQQQTAISNTTGQTGWGGRISDVTGDLNGSVVLPMNISVAGTSLFATGITSRQLTIGTGALSSVLNLSWSGPASANPFTAGSSYRQLLGMDLGSFLVKSASDTTNQALSADAVLNQPDPVIPTLPNTTAFPSTSLGNQLKQVAKLIKIKDTLGMKRQIFFCSLGGFDTHTNETGSAPTNPAGGGANSGTQGGLMTQLSQAMRAFYDEMVAQGRSNDVVQFTLSDFGRTLQASGTGAQVVGSDHAWGSHAFIIGGPVVGGRFYGQLRPDGTGLPFGYPTLALGGPDDTDNRGRWIPTTAVDQFAATLASWYGLAPADVPKVFPNLGKFAAANLGFLA